MRVNLSEEWISPVQGAVKSPANHIGHNPAVCRATDCENSDVPQSLIDSQLFRRADAGGYSCLLF